MAFGNQLSDLTPQQLRDIRNPNPKKGLSGRELLARYLGCNDPSNPKHVLTLDLYVHVLQFAQSLSLTDAKLSALLAAIQEVHRQSTAVKLTIEESFQYLKTILQTHSIHRPPYSVGVFTPAESRQIMEWMLDTYYRHYKLYQYAFTDRVTMTANYHHPTEAWELPPTLPPLDEAMTEGEWQAVCTEEERQREAQRQADEQAAATAAEAERQRQLRAEYEASIPDEIKTRVITVVEENVRLLRTAMAEQWVAKEASLRESIAHMEEQLRVRLQGGLGAGAGAGGSSRPTSSRPASSKAPSAK